MQVDEIQTDFTPKPSRETGEPLDFAITGEGFFSVRTAEGVRYTRNGQFTVSPQGLLVTAQGDPVLGRGGRTLQVGADGRVDPRALDIVQLTNPRKAGDNLVAGTPAGAGGVGQARAGALEASGADAARSMVDMIASLRSFEAGQRVITTIDETLQKAANTVGGSAASRPRAERSAQAHAARADPDRRHARRTQHRRGRHGRPADAHRLRWRTTSPTRTPPATSACAWASATWSTRRRAAPPPRARRRAPARRPSTPGARSPRAPSSARTSRSTSPSRARASCASASPTAPRALTRDGSLHIDGDGRLVTSTGAFVQPAITFPADTDTSTIKIESDGAVRAGERAVGRLELVSVRSPQRLLAAGDNVFVAHAGVRRAAPGARRDHDHAGGARGLQRRRLRGDGGHDRVPARLPAHLQGDPTADQMWEIANGVKR